MRPSRGYRDSCSFQTATIIYDATYWFCEKYVDRRSRTNDQMVQGARSGRQNIAEGCRAAATSSQTELLLLNVARSSLEELLLDYEDFLRHRRFPQWDPESPDALAVRQVPRNFKQDQSDQIPICPVCGSLMVLRTARSGRSAGKQFWGCSTYPDCRGVINL